MNLNIKSISKAYGKTKSLINFSAALTSGIYALLGSYGSGKSTLVGEPDILILDEPTAGLDPK